jgi:hypothetical protein
MTDDTPLPFDLSAVRRKKLTIDFDGGNQSSDGGLLLLRHAERKLGVCRRIADAMADRRDPSRIRHAVFEMVMARVSAIACGHKDGIDLDRLRHDPLMKVAVGRCPESGTLSLSQSPAGRIPGVAPMTPPHRPHPRADGGPPAWWRSLDSRCCLFARWQNNVRGSGIVRKRRPGYGAKTRVVRGRVARARPGSSACL